MAVVERFGRWLSPLSPADAAAARRSRAGLASDGAFLYWLESRPSEGGRTVLVRVGPEGRIERSGDPVARDLSPPGVSLRSRVHEYGGGAYCLVPADEGGGRASVGTGGTAAVAYVDQDDQRVWLFGVVATAHRGGSAPPRPLSAEPGDGVGWRHGDLRAVPGGRWVLAVREEHAEGRVSRSVVAYSTAPGVGPEARPGTGVVLLEGRDFYAAPRPDGTGRRLAWICWDHPDMPWDASELWVADLELDGGPAVGGAEKVAGGPAAASSGATSVGQPLWCADGSLVFAWDAAGWWQPYRRRRAGEPPACLSDEEAEVHGPDWSLGQATIAELPGGTLAYRRRRDGFDSVVVLRPGSGGAELLDQPCVSVSAVCRHGDGVAWLGATPEMPVTAWWSPGTAAAVHSRARTYAPTEPLLVARGNVSVALHFSFQGRGGRTVHGLYYRPTLAGTDGPPGTAPPLVVACHGGPTGQAEAGFDPVVQLLTTRGYAVAAVDYSGSTGYGRAYRDRLRGGWGEDDVDDCVDAARHLATEGRADPARMGIRGASAGGLTALAALARSEVFAAAVSWYGVTDLLSLAASTHDFESHYTDRLVGPLPAAEDEYRRRSPVNRVDDMAGSVLILQGLDDPVVPPSQAEAMVTALRARGLDCRFRGFAGESHGFRRAETLQASLEAELDFYAERLAAP